MNSLKLQTRHASSMLTRLCQHQVTACLTLSVRPCLHRYSDGVKDSFKGEVKAKIKISPVVVFGVLSRMVLV